MDGSVLPLAITRTWYSSFSLQVGRQVVDGGLFALGRASWVSSYAEFEVWRVRARQEPSVQPLQEQDLQRFVGHEQGTTVLVAEPAVEVLRALVREGRGHDHVVA